MDLATLINNYAKYIEKLLSEGNSLKDVAAGLEIGYEALRKAVQRGKIVYKKKA